MVERELKLSAGPGFQLPDLDGILPGVEAEQPEFVRMQTIYHDTPDLRLARWGCSLRHRSGEGWTLKLPTSATGPLLERTELTFPGGAGKAPAAALAWSGPTSDTRHSSPWPASRPAGASPG